MMWQGPLLGAMAGALLAGGAAWQARGAIEKGACAAKIEKVSAAAAVVIEKKDQEILTTQAERDQARGEVEKVNAATRKQFEDLQGLIVADQAARNDATLRSDRTAQQAAREVREAAAKFQSGLEAIRHVADECARAPVSDDVRRVLDGILATP